MTKKPKILVVEDDPSGLHFLTSLLTRSGYEVAEAVNGSQALERVKAQRFDLVVSDILMPVMDGFELAQKIRTDPAVAEIPILFYSATYHEQQARWLAEACGATERLNKPADPQVILNAVKKALNSAARPLKLDPYVLIEEHARLLSDKVATKVRELEDNQQRLEREIEQHQTTETALRKTEEEHRSIVREAPYGIYRSDGDGNLLMTNPALAKILGYEAEEDLRKVNLERDVYVLPEERRRLLAEAQPTMIPSEQQWRRKDGEEITVRLMGRKLPGPVAAYEVFVEDITTQRRLEQQFLQAQKMEAIGRLAGSVAHDFNNLLMAIGGYTDLLLARLGENSDLLHYAEEIKKATQRSAGLTRQLLTFSRKQVTMATVIDLKELLADLSSMLQHLLGPRITFSINTGSRPLYLEADRNQLEQVLVNLAVNARDAMPNGGSLRVEAFDTQLADDSRLPSGWYVCLSVTDTGHGIEKQLQHKIFEPFFTTKGRGGTGLGLATVYGIVNHAKGEVRVQSEPGRGTTFTVLLPLSVKPVMLPPAEGTMETASGQERILLVDDEEALRLSMQEYLEARGYSVVTARNGAEALEILRKENGSIHLMVTDLMMPGISGDDLARTVWERDPGFAVLFISGYMDEPAHKFVSARHAGSDYIEKPFPLADLAAKIRLLLDKAPTQDPRQSDKAAATLRV